MVRFVSNSQRALTGATFAAALGAALAGMSPAAADAAVSATIVPGTLVQGSTQASLTGGEYADVTNNLGDWPLNTGSFGGSSFAISLTNANFNGGAFGGTPDSMIAFGNGGGVTLQFAQPVNALAGQKEFGLFTAQMLNGGNGALFAGNMEAAVLVSADGVAWRTLAGESVASPTTYVATSHKLNAPAHAYDYGTFAAAWSAGFGASEAALAALPIGDFTAPMPDDNLFNGTATNADRFALQGNGSTAAYDAAFGASGGGNWFDISASGLPAIQFVRLNGVNTDGGVRLDAAFANAAAVPEPATTGLFVLAGLGGLWLLPRARRHVGKATASSLIAAVTCLSSASSATAVTFDDVDFWVGTGANRAAMVVDWNDGKSAESLVWGYRWDGAATGETMLRAVVAADDRLFAHFGADTGFGVPLWGAGYDLDADGSFAVTPSLAFDAGGASAGPGDESRAPADAADHWREANFTSAFWGYYVGGTGSSPAWGFADTGMTGRVLTNNAWDGWSFAPGFNGTDPSEPVAAAVPEPATAGLFGLAVLALSCGRRRRCQTA